MMLRAINWVISLSGLFEAPTAKPVVRIPESERLQRCTDLIYLLGQTHKWMTPQQVIDLLEPHVEEAKGRLLTEQVNRGNYPGDTTYHAGERYTD